MIIRHEIPWPRRLFIWLKRHWNWSVFGAHMLGVVGIVATLFAWQVREVFPWHFSFVLLFLIGFQSWYCSRYYRLKHERFTPQRGYDELHSFAEALRELGSSDYASLIRKAEKDELTVEQLDPIVREHCQFAQKACKHLLEIMKHHGLKFERVCIKLNVQQKLVRLADQTSCRGDIEKGEPTAQNLFWRLLCKLHLEYEKWIAQPSVQQVPGNRRLQKKPRFLGLADLGRKDEPPSFVDIAQILPAKPTDEAPAPTDRTIHASARWSDIRQAVDNRYEQCLGIMICGPEFSDPLLPRPKNEETREFIGFIGLDARRESPLDFLDQNDVNSAAVIADALYAPMQNLRTFWDALLRQKEKSSTAGRNPASNTPAT